MNINIRFPLTKSDGGGIHKDDFSLAELQNISKCINQTIFFEPELINVEGIKIKKLLVYYDGIKKLPNEDFGYKFKGNDLVGYPAPIIGFNLNKKVDKDEFRKAIWTSSISICTQKMSDQDREPYFAEDHNGYTSVLSDIELNHWLDLLGAKAFNPPRELSFINKMPEYGGFSYRIYDLTNQISYEY
tara:strand:- start:7005 stop:7565 length:561 start_codon:yes stop_codon:yes gene_type:complete